MTAWYNEPDPYAAAWLRNLIAAGVIAPGVVDERKIQDVEAWELAHYTQCHFFAGIGVWSGALRAAGWPDDMPIWTGSCPCQPFSAAGKQKGFTDDRHLWPIWFNRFIKVCRPPIVVGEQVASKDGLGWLDIVSADMEAAGYAVGASDLCAAGLGQAHLRQRLYFVGLADSDGEQCDEGLQPVSARSAERLGGDFEFIGMADALHSGRSERWTGARDRSPSWSGDNGGLGHSDNARSQEHRGSGDVYLREPDGKNSGRQHEHASFSDGVADGNDEQLDRSRAAGERARDDVAIRSGASFGTFLHSWEAGSLDDADWLLCRNPTGEPCWRPVEPGTFPLAHGITGRVGKLRAYGNALDFKTAKGFSEVVAEIVGIRPLELEYDL